MLSTLMSERDVEKLINEWVNGSVWEWEKCWRWVHDNRGGVDGMGTNESKRYDAKCKWVSTFKWDITRWKESEGVYEWISRMVRRGRWGWVCTWKSESETASVWPKETKWNVSAWVREKIVSECASKKEGDWERAWKWMSGWVPEFLVSEQKR